MKTNAMTRKRAALMILATLVTICISFALSQQTVYAASGKWKKSGGKKVYVLANGKKANGLTKVKANGKTDLYYFKKGIPQKGWKTAKSKKYYFDAKTKKAVSGVKTIKKKTYVFTSKKYLAGTGIFKIGKKAYFAKKGVLKIGLVTYKKNKYYSTKKGLAVGLQMIKGEHYYFNKKTFAMVKNKAIGDFYFGKDGRGIAKEKSEVTLRNNDQKDNVTPAEASKKKIISIFVKCKYSAVNIWDSVSEDDFIVTAKYDDGTYGQLDPYTKGTNSDKYYHTIIFDETNWRYIFEVYAYEYGSRYDHHEYNEKMITGSTFVSINSNIGKGSLKLLTPKETYTNLPIVLLFQPPANNFENLGKETYFNIGTDHCGIDFADVKYLDSPKLPVGSKVEGGYLKILSFKTPGIHRLTVTYRNRDVDSVKPADENGFYDRVEPSLTLAEISIRVKDYNTAFNSWMDSVIRETTTLEMSKPDMLNAISMYISKRAVYPYNYIDSEGNTRVVSLIQGYGKPIWENYRMDSCASPALLKSFADRIGYPVINLYYGDDWSMHWYVEGVEDGHIYSCCPSGSTGRLEGVTCEDDIPKIDLLSYTAS